MKLVTKPLQINQTLTKIIAPTNLNREPIKIDKLDSAKILY